VKRFKEILESKQPYVVLLIGTPLSGKSTLLSKHFNDEKYTLISRDDILMETADTLDYNEAWHIISSKEDGQSSVDKKLKYRLMEVSKKGENVIIDMTNLTFKGRRKHLAKFPKYFKCAIVFDFLTNEEYIKRNQSREIKENKHIGMDVIERMKDSYEEITDEEGFDLVIRVKDLKT